MGIELTSNCNDALNHSKTIATEFSHAYVTGEHVFISLLDKSKTVKDVFDIIKVPAASIKKAAVKTITEKIPAVKLSDRGPNFSPKLSKIVTLAGIQAKNNKSPVIGTLHLLLGIIESGGLVVDILEQNGISEEFLQRAVLDDLGDDGNIEPDDIHDEMEFAGMEEQSQTYSKRNSKPISNNTLLKSFSVELTERAVKGLIDPVIGRNKEIDKLIQVLLRRQKNNPMIVGEAGVGKTAIVEGLALRIINGDVPEKLVNKKIFTIDLGAIISGTKYRGQFEERVKGILKELSNRKDCIAFIDEFHNVVGSGNSEGSLDACNLLKPVLARREITVIGATTYSEYKQYIESDNALIRRFQNIHVSEPTPIETIGILKGLKKEYEQHHNVKYKVEALDSIVNLTDRYITDRYFPDKAIDALDQVAAKARSQLLASSAFDIELEKEITLCEKMKDSCMKNEEWSKAEEYEEKQFALEQEYEQNFKLYNKKLNKKITIGSDHIEQLISQMTGIPCERLDNNSMSRLKKISSLLSKEVIGQDNAIKLISNSIKRSRVGLSDERSPIGTFLFLGPTGVGKTHLTKQLCEYLFGDEDKMIRFDMSEYMEAHSVSKLIGSPPGYIGYGEGGKLTEAVKREPYSVILFDEIEKAHEDIYNILLQLLDEGQLTDASNMTVNFKNCIIVLTSNIGANKIQKNDTMGFLGGEYNDQDDKIMKEVEKNFRPEFINRLDEIVIFNHLDTPELTKIVKQMISDLKQRLKRKKVSLNVSKDVIDYLIEKGCDTKYGARPLKRAIKNNLECKLADYIIDNNIVDRCTINADLNEGTIVLSTNSPKKRTSNSAKKMAISG